MGDAGRDVGQSGGGMGGGFLGEDGMEWASILSYLLLLRASGLWSGIGRNVNNVCGLPRRGV